MPEMMLPGIASLVTLGLLAVVFVVAVVKEFRS